MIKVNADLCTRDSVCVAVCPSGFLAINKEGHPEEVAGGRCIFCGHCVAACDYNALTHSGLPREALLPASENLPAPALIDGFLNSRRSVREFKETPLSKEVLEALLDVARRAPTASNSQLIRWIVVGDGAKVHALSAEVMNWMRNSNYDPGMVEKWEKGEDVVLRGAPTVVVAYAPEQYAWGKVDGAIALTFLELAAEARGIGVCWAGFLTHVAGVHAPIRQLLSVPEGYSVVGGVMLGEGKYEYRRIPPRKPLNVQWL
jgi:nitroreductase/NAD-dependent dihydropyrimidine dehydrogenase PreA subunit